MTGKRERGNGRESHIITLFSIPPCNPGGKNSKLKLQTQRTSTQITSTPATADAPPQGHATERWSCRRGNPQSNRMTTCQKVSENLAYLARKACSQEVARVMQDGTFPVPNCLRCISPPPYFVQPYLRPLICGICTPC